MTSTGNTIGSIKSDIQLAPYSITVTHTETSSENKSNTFYTLFFIQIQWAASPDTNNNNINKWTVSHRYSEFESLRSTLSLHINNLPPLPAKTWLRSFDSKLIEQRKSGLQQWLQSVAEIEFIARHPLWHTFLQLPESITNHLIQSIPIEIKSIKDPQFGVCCCSYYEAELIMFTATEDCNLLSRIDRKVSNMRFPWETKGGMVPVGSFSCWKVDNTGSDSTADWKLRATIYFPVQVSAIEFDSSMRRVFVGLENGRLIDYKADIKFEDFSPIPIEPTVNTVITVGSANSNSNKSTEPVADGLQAHTDRITGMALWPSQQLVLSVSRDKRLVCYNYNTTTIISNTIASTAWLSAIAFDPEYSRCFISTYASTVVIYSLLDPIKPILLHTLTDQHYSGSIRSLYFYSPERYLFTGGFDQQTGIWNINNSSTAADNSRSRLVGILKNGPANKKIKSIVFSPKYRQVFCGLDGGLIAVWAIESGRLLYVFTAHKDAVVSLHWLNDSSILLSASLDGKVKFWKCGQPPVKAAINTSNNTQQSTISPVSTNSQSQSQQQQQQSSATSPHSLPTEIAIAVDHIDPFTNTTSATQLPTVSSPPRSTSGGFDIDPSQLTDHDL